MKRQAISTSLVRQYSYCIVLFQVEDSAEFKLRLNNVLSSRSWDTLPDILDTFEQKEILLTSTSMGSKIKNSLVSKV